MILPHQEVKQDKTQSSDAQLTLFSERSSMDILAEASSRELKIPLANFRPRWSSLKDNEYKDLSKMDELRFK